VITTSSTSRPSRTSQAVGVRAPISTGRKRPIGGDLQQAAEILDALVPVPEPDCQDEVRRRDPFDRKEVEPFEQVLIFRRSQQQIPLSDLCVGLHNPRRQGLPCRLASRVDPIIEILSDAELRKLLRQPFRAHRRIREDRHSLALSAQLRQTLYRAQGKARTPSWRAPTHPR
jgi:hypothetical protein